MQLLINLNRSDERPLQVQIYESIRQMILSGALRPGQRLPSTRSVCEQLGIARNTVVLAYARLTTEDYVSSRTKAGIFVNENLPDVGVMARYTHSAEGDRAKGLQRMSIPPGTDRALELWKEKTTRPKFDFFVGRLHPSSFPTKFWQRSAMRHLAYAHGVQVEYGDPRGLKSLRQAIAGHLRTTRGIDAHPDQVLITSGIQGGLNLLARIFLRDRSRSAVAIENPCYQGASFLFGSYGARLHPIPVDAHGIVVSQLKNIRCKLLYVTPSHQFPTGCTLSLDRRLHLLEWAYRTGTYVIEDDYDGDFRYDGPPLTALAGLDRSECVIYMGTFSKSLGAGMRLGYLVLPRQLLGQAQLMKALLDHGAPWLEQAVVADFLTQGAFIRHLRRIRHLYMTARNALVEAVEHHFPGSVLSGKECGMHMLWTMPSDLPTAEEMQRLALSAGVGLYPVSAAAAHEFGNARRLTNRSLVVGYTALSSDEIREGLARVAAIVPRRA